MGKLLFGNSSASPDEQKVQAALPIVEKVIETKIIEVPVEVQVEVEKIREVQVERIVEKLDDSRLIELDTKMDEMSDKLESLRKVVQESLRSVEDEIHTFDIVIQSQEEMVDKAIKSVEDLHQIEKAKQAQLDLDIEKFKETMDQLNARISAQNFLMIGSTVLLLITIIAFIVNQ